MPGRRGRGKLYFQRAISEATGQPMVLVRLVLNALADLIIRELSEGRRVTWVGLGTWMVKERRVHTPIVEGKVSEPRYVPMVLFRPALRMRAALMGRGKKSR